VLAGFFAAIRSGIACAEGGRKKRYQSDHSHVKILAVIFVRRKKAGGITVADNAQAQFKRANRQQRNEKAAKIPE